MAAGPHPLMRVRRSEAPSGALRPRAPSARVRHAGSSSERPRLARVCTRWGDVRAVDTGRGRSRTVSEGGPELRKGGMPRRSDVRGGDASRQKMPAAKRNRER